jgi:hypothetical protein
MHCATVLIERADHKRCAMQYLGLTYVRLHYLAYKSWVESGPTGVP